VAATDLDVGSRRCVGSGRGESGCHRSRLARIAGRALQQQLPAVVELRTTMESAIGSRPLRTRSRSLASTRSPGSCARRRRLCGRDSASRATSEASRRSGRPAEPSTDAPKTTKSAGIRARAASRRRDAQRKQGFGEPRDKRSESPVVGRPAEPSTDAPKTTKSAGIRARAASRRRDAQRTQGFGEPRDERSESPVAGRPAEQPASEPKVSEVGWEAGIRTRGRACF
jgi:hypothetical protein